MGFFNKHYFIGLASGVLLSFVIVLLGTLLVFHFWFDPGTYLPVPPFPDSSHGQMDYTWSVRTLEGTEVSLSSFRGKPIYLNFWATWCTPCVLEMPSIQNLYDALKSEEVVFLVVSDEEEETVRSFIEEQEFTLPVYLYRGDLPEVLRWSALPTTLIVDGTGRIVFRHMGAAQWDHDSSLNFLRGLM